MEKALYIHETVTAHASSGINFATYFLSVRDSQPEAGNLFIEVLH